MTIKGEGHGRIGLKLGAKLNRSIVFSTLSRSKSFSGALSGSRFNQRDRLAELSSESSLWESCSHEERSLLDHNRSQITQEERLKPSFFR
jgi:hypothetical protein